MTRVPDELRGRWIWWYQAIGIVIGMAGLAWLWTSIGTDAITSRLRTAGPALAAVVGIDVVINLLRARVLHVFLRRTVSYPRVLVAQLAGGAMADLSPAGVLGEPTKASMLLGRAPAPAVVSSIVAYDFASLYATTIIMFAGIAVAIATGEVPSGVTRLLVATSIFLLVTVGVAVWLARRGLATSLVGLVRPRWRDRWRAWLEDLDRGIREVHGRDRRDTIHGVALHLVVRVLAWVEFAILLDAVGVSLDAHTFLVLAVCQGPVMKFATVLPLGLGVTDAGVAALFTLFGLPAATGAGVAMLHRLRSLVGDVIGLATMFVGR